MDNRIFTIRAPFVAVAIAVGAASVPSHAQDGASSSSSSSSAAAAAPSAIVPTTAPTEGRGEGRGRREGREPWGDRDGRSDRRERREGGPAPFPDKGSPAAVTDQEWAQVMESLRSGSPHRWKMLTKMLEGEEKPFHAKVRAGVTRRYRELGQLEKSDPERHALEVRRDGIEDAIFGMLDEYRAGRTEERKASIREKVAALVDTRLELRKLRLARVQSELAALRMDRSGDALRAESAEAFNAAGREEMIDRTLEGFLRHARPGSSRRSRGEGGGPPPPAPPPPASPSE